MLGPTLFPDWTWRIPLPGEFATIKKVNTDVCSKYNLQKGGVKEATLHGPTLSAILACIRVEEESSSAQYFGGLGTQDEGKIIVSEFPGEAEEVQAVVFNHITGKFQASKFAGINSRERYDFSELGEAGTALLFALMPVAKAEEEFLQHYNNLKKALSATSPDTESLRKSSAILCDNLYRRITNALNLNDDGIKVVLNKAGNISELTSGRLARGDYTPETVLTGAFRILSNSAPNVSKKAVRLSEFAGRYALQENREFSDEEKLMIPKLEDWYIIPPEVEMICVHAKETTQSNAPMRNFLLRGPAGAGKTEAAKAMAAGLHLPYKHFTCSSDTEILDLLGQMLPVNSDDSMPDYTELPTFEDICMDPGTAYYKLTGEYKEVDEAVVYQALLKSLQLRFQKETSQTGYRFVDSPLIEAMEKGYLIELQEPSCIAKPGVLVGLNSLLDNCRSVTLPTGKLIRRHPDTVFVITTNIDYAGCREMNQSLLSRMQLKVDVKEPDAKTLVERAVKITGCKQMDVVKNMVKCLKAISEKCRADMITDGSCGSRELVSWVQSYMLIQDELTAAQYTVIPSATSDEEAQAELVSTCLEPEFGV